MKKMKVNICGIPHEVIECSEEFTVASISFGEITFKDCQIKINKDMPESMKKEALCHEMVHGILLHIGRDELGNDETFVQSLGNAIYQGFDVKEL